MTSMINTNVFFDFTGFQVPPHHVHGLARFLQIRLWFCGGAGFGVEKESENAVQWSAASVQQQPWAANQLQHVARRLQVCRPHFTGNQSRIILQRFSGVFDQGRRV